MVERVDIGPKRINSTPTSPMIKRIIRDVPRVLDTRIGTTENTLNSTTPRPLSPNGIGLVSNRNTTGLNSPMDTTPNPQQPSPSKPSSEYFEFTRPSKPSDQPMKPKNKKISIVSNRSGCTSTLNNNWVLLIFHYFIHLYPYSCFEKYNSFDELGGVEIYFVCAQYHEEGCAWCEEKIGSCR